MVDRKMPRVQKVVLPILKAELPEVKVVSWVPGTANRTFPLVNIRRISGISNFPDRLDKPVIEMTAYARGDEIAVTEDLYLDARLVLEQAVEKQTIVPGVGYLHSFFEVMGPNQFDSPYDRTWRIQGLIQLGLRPVRTT